MAALTLNYKRSAVYTFFIVLLWVLWGRSGPAYSAAIEAVSAQEAAALTAAYKDSPGFVILDIRTPPEFQSGHLPGAQLVDYYSRDFQERLKALDKEKMYLIYCRSGNRSGRALSLFSQLGFNRIYHMEGGVNSWIKAGFPLVR